MENKIDIREGKFRLTNIIYLDKFTGPDDIVFSTKDTKEGLALECRCDEKHYYVIAFLNWKEKEHSVEMETVLDRFHKEIIAFEEWKIVRSLIIEGYRLINEANSIEED